MKYDSKIQKQRPVKIYQIRNLITYSPFLNDVVSLVHSLKNQEMDI